jgi:predicted outer membrane protein
LHSEADLVARRAWQQHDEPDVFDLMSCRRSVKEFLVMGMHIFRLRRPLFVIALVSVCCAANPMRAQSGSGASQQGAAPGGQAAAETSESGLGHSAINQQAGGSGSRLAAGQNQHTELEQMISLDLLLGNQEEVALARLAQQHAQSDEVRQFADMMIKDHEKAISQLREIAPHLASIGLSDDATNSPNSAAAQTNANANSARRGADTGAGNRGSSTGTHAVAIGSTAGGGDTASFQQNVARNCLELVKGELQEHQGADFDMAYIGQQVSAHITMLAKLQASESATTGELKDFVTQAAATVQHHRSMAKDIKKQLKQRQQRDTGGSTAEGTNRATRQ